MPDACNVVLPGVSGHRSGGPTVAEKRRCADYLDIPEEIMDVAWRTFNATLDESDSCNAVVDAITAAAPLIVAAELRKLAEECLSTQPWSLLTKLCERADELDPPVVSRD